MGLSHLVIIKGLMMRPLNVTVIDPSFINRLMFRFLLNNKVNFFKDISDFDNNSSHNFDYALITTPPTVRKSVIDIARKRANKVFLEKPVLVPLCDRSMSGYVLQHCPMNGVVRSLIPRQGLRAISASLETNLSFGDASKNWRGGKFGTVLYEFGGHLLTLVASSNEMGFFCDPADLEKNLIIECCEPNKAEYRYSLSDGLLMNFSLISNSERVRKARYEVTFDYDNYQLIYDIYSLKKRFKDTDETVTVKNIASEGFNSPFYLRGFEFTNQMTAFLNGDLDVLSIQQIKNIEEIVEYVASA